MSKIQISYDLKKPDKDYQKLYDYIKSFQKWARPLESLWVVKTSKTSREVRDELQNHVDQNDKLLVIDVTDDSMDWYNLDQEVSDWLKA